MQKGIVKQWIDDKGFGFIQIGNDDEHVFLHISALQRSARRPIVGDIIYCSVEVDINGRKKATNASIEGVMSVFVETPVTPLKISNKQKAPSRDYAYRSRSRISTKSKNSGVLSKVLMIMMVFSVVFFTHKYKTDNHFPEVSLQSFMASESESKVENLVINDRFQCSGKTRCAQMTSCEEAMFYLKNCPGSVTDGDGDGLPCEDQWCGH
ncbi:MAG: cold shock domain-containing protein [Methylococcaceae bacterium]|nr:cold shock domain-containing protein [Methylococcaceae bacterium]MDZ4155336.1 cold shock domain-containing protein [Methylococcales bacterium]MDP2393948.1 cold shock domain-containing protein [Methylococcaceae bacterium]MDP3018064.1 cold shock domain-containing protein [Methylococcaceae bacterium]MDP3391825.1 cold shock domain-containing protein [Methylococcaceae bacterium]